MFWDKLKKPCSVIVDRLASGLFIDKGKRHNFKELSEFAFGFIGSAGIGEESSAFEQNLMKIRHHSARIAKPVSFGKEAVDKFFMRSAPILLGASGCVKFAFLTQ